MQIYTSMMHILRLLTTVDCLPRQAQPSQVYFTGKVKSESDMKVESDIGSAITHQFRVSTGRLLDQKWLYLNVYYSSIQRQYVL